MTDRIDELVTTVIAADLARERMLDEGAPQAEVEVVYHQTVGAAIQESGMGGVPLLMNVIHFAATAMVMLGQHTGVSGEQYLQNIALVQAQDHHQ